MTWVGFEPTIAAFERTKTVHALNRATTVIDSTPITHRFILCFTVIGAPRFGALENRALRIWPRRSYKIVNIMRHFIICRPCSTRKKSYNIVVGKLQRKNYLSVDGMIILNWSWETDIIWNFVSSTEQNRQFHLMATLGNLVARGHILNSEGQTFGGDLSFLPDLESRTLFSFCFTWTAFVGITPSSIWSQG
jgi:hypothetical protein